VGRSGGPIEPPLFTVLDRRLVGEGDGGMLDKVSTVRSDNDSRCRRCSCIFGSPALSTLWLAAFSSPSPTTAVSALVFGGVVLSEP
jgi:hypothetical protein